MNLRVFSYILFFLSEFMNLTSNTNLPRTNEKSDVENDDILASSWIPLELDLDSP